MKTFETFLRIVPALLTDEAPALDESWMVPRGIEAHSPQVLKTLRDVVLPMLTGVDSLCDLEWFAFLVHAYPLVPTTADDKSVYLHVRLGFDEHVIIDEAMLTSMLPDGWQFTRACELGDIAGVDNKALANNLAWHILGSQSQWLMEFIEDHKDADLGTLVKHTRQFLHFLANMTQMRVA